MIITGGSAILRAYLETVTGHVRKVPKKLRSEDREPDARRRPPCRDAPDLRDNFVGRMRAALDWFSHPADPRAALHPHEGAPGRRGGLRDLHGARMGDGEGDRQQPLLRPVGRVPLRRQTWHTPHGERGTGASSSLSGGAKAEAPEYQRRATYQ